MDHHDSKARGVANDAEHLYSLEDKESLRKDKGFSNSCQHLVDENMKHGHSSDHKVNNCEADSLPEKENSSNCGHVSASDCTKGDNRNNLKPQSSAVSTSKSSLVEGASWAACCSNEFGSSTFENNHGHDVNAKRGTDFVQQISLKSGISSDTLERESNRFDVRGRTHENWQSAAEIKPILHSTLNDTQHKTESSSSNSTNIILQVSSSNKSYPEISLEAKSSHHHGNCVSGSICTDIKSSLEGPVAESVLLGMAAQITQKAVENIRAREGKKVPSMTKEQNSMFAREVDHKVGFHREASVTSSSMEEKNGEVAHLSSVDSADPNISNCSIEIRQGVKSHNEELVGPVIMNDANDGCHGRQLSQLTTKTEDIASSERTSLHNRFDLNEDLGAHEVESASFEDVVSVSKPVPVMAKSGFSPGLPTSPLKFQGKLGLKGSGATSAFRSPTLLRSSSRNTSSISDNNCSSKHSQGFTGFDLNIAVTEENTAMELPRESIAISSCSQFDKSSAEVSSKKAERLDFDLNCLGENEGECPQPSPPVSGCKMVDFDLNDNPSLGDTCNDAYSGSRTKVFDSSTRQLGSSYLRPAYFGDLGSMQGFSHGHYRPFMVAAPNFLPQNEQMHRVVPSPPNLPYLPHTPPSHGYPYYNAFCVGPADTLPSNPQSSGYLPYVADPRGASLTPRMMGPVTHPTFQGAPNLMEVAYGRNPRDTTNIRPSFDANTGEHSSDSGSRGGNNARQFLFPGRNAFVEGEMNHFQQVALSSKPVKRKEPEGGWDPYQLGYRQLASWN